MSQSVSQSDFATIMGVNKSTVSRWKKDGRLVMDGAKVLVDESKQRIKETEGGRDDVAKRHAANKGEEAEPESPEITKAKETRATAQARKETAQADLAEMERDKMAGLLIEREAISGVVETVFIDFRQALESMRHRLKTRLVMQKADAIDGIVKEEAIEMLAKLEREYVKQVSELIEDVS